MLPDVTRQSRESSIRRLFGYSFRSCALGDHRDYLGVWMVVGHHKGVQGDFRVGEFPNRFTMQRYTSSSDTHLGQGWSLQPGIAGWVRVEAHPSSVLALVMSGLRLEGSSEVFSRYTMGASGFTTCARPTAAIKTQAQPHRADPTARPNASCHPNYLSIRIAPTPPPALSHHVTPTTCPSASPQHHRPP
eukprot:1179762-Prorocentrum_minimum.AAC.5